MMTGDRTLAKGSHVANLAPQLETPASPDKAAPKLSQKSLNPTVKASIGNLGFTSIIFQGSSFLPGMLTAGGKASAN